jgi:hypothetical protein
VQQKAAKAGMSSHKAKVENRWFLRALMRDPATSGKRPQRAANVSFSAC